MSIMKSIVWTIGIFGIVIFALACGDDDDESHTAPTVSSVAGSAVGSAVESVSGGACDHAACSRWRRHCGNGHPGGLASACDRID